MLDVARHHNPGVHSLLIDGTPRARKRWLGERTDWNGDVLRTSGQRVEDGRAAVRAKVEVNLAARVADPDVLTGLTRYGDCLRRKAGLGTEDAARATLTGEAVTDGDA